MAQGALFSLAGNSMVLGKSALANIAAPAMKPKRHEVVVVVVVVAALAFCAQTNFSAWHRVVVPRLKPCDWRRRRRIWHDTTRDGWFED